MVTTSVVDEWRPSEGSSYPQLSLGGEIAVLAPMVRLGTLPLRLFALQSGADAVFSEEIIDRKLASCCRTVNPRLRTVDFIPGCSDIVGASQTPGKGGAVLRIHAKEQEKLVVQLGTADAAGALQAAQVVARDVVAIDINLGCPKHAAMDGGMGAALLQKPEVRNAYISTA